VENRAKFHKKSKRKEKWETEQNIRKKKNCADKKKTEHGKARHCCKQSK